MTPLMWTVAYDDTACAAELLRTRADIGAVDDVSGPALLGIPALTDRTNTRIHTFTLTRACDALRPAERCLTKLWNVTLNTASMRCFVTPW